MALSFSSYHTDQLISYIGSKRMLLGQLKTHFSHLQPKRKTCRFLDPFCGSGAVSRLARSMGMIVHSCDNQYFSVVINNVYLGLSSKDLVSLFANDGGIDGYYALINMHGLYASETGNGIEKAYLSAHYAPKDDVVYDHRSERLFFTPANARFLDAVREHVQRDWSEGYLCDIERDIVVSSILYEATQRANIAGTFCSFIKKLPTTADPLRSRIAKRSTLQIPFLPDDDVLAGTMELSDAQDFVSSYSADICYLDPPAKVQQYGNGYHLLNSLALWDYYEPSAQLDSSQSLIDTSGIRNDWKSTLSPFCSLKHADKALLTLLGRIDARNIVLSYPSTGIISVERIHELLSYRQSPVRVFTLAKRNHGGRGKAKDEVEYLFVTGKTPSYQVPVKDDFTRIALIGRIESLSSSVFNPTIVGTQLSISMIGYVLLDDMTKERPIIDYSTEELAIIASHLERGVCSTLDEALLILVQSYGGLFGAIRGKERAIIQKKIIAILRNIVAEQGVTELMETVDRLTRETIGLLEDPLKTHMERCVSSYIR